MRRFASWLILGFVLYAGRAELAAQAFQGGLRGAVRDVNGIIPGVQVTLVNEGTNVSRSTVSNEAGEYAFAAVTPGTYTVRAVLQGFKTFERRGLNIGTQQFITLDLAMEVGTIQEEISVTAAAPLIETSNASTGEVLDKAALDTLPAPGRNAFMIAISVPTVIATGDPQFNRAQDQSNSSFLSLGGGTRRGNNYLVDGTAVTDLVNRAVLIPSIEAVEEVKVQVHTYDAEMSRTGGGVFNVTMKSGSNSYHGTAAYQTRPVWGQANNWFSKRAGIPKNEDTYYRLYNGAFGGPIVRDRTFFWSATEGYRSLTTRNGELIWPTTRQRNGDFSQTTDRNGNLVVIYDPLTTRSDPSRPGQFIRDPFPGNVIPADRISQVARNLVGFMPQPDTEVSNQLANYRRTASIIDRSDMISTKIEHKFSDKISLTGAFVYNATDEPGSDYLKAGRFAPQDVGTTVLSRRPKVLTLNGTIIPNSSSVLSLRYGLTSFPDPTTHNPFDPSGLGFPASYVSAMQDPKFPRINVLDYGEIGTTATLGDGGSNDTKWYSQNAHASYSRFVGRHTVKIGGDVRRMGVSAQPFGQSAGEFFFDRAYTGANPLAQSRASGDAIASLLLGYVSPETTRLSVNQIVEPLDLTLRYYGGYVQDDWRMNDKLTINFGLRYEYETGISEKNNSITVAFDRAATSPLRPTAPLPDGRTTVTGGLRYAGQDGFPEYQGDPSKKKLGPRGGVAWTLDDKTVVRGGYGLFWAPWNYPGIGTTNYGQIGFSQETFVDPGSSLIPRLTARGTGPLDDPFPNGLLQPVGSAAGLLAGLGRQIEFVNPDRQSPYVQQYSVDVQRELPGNMALSVGYVGARGDQLSYGGTAEALVNINQLDPALLSMGSALVQQVPNPFFGTAAANVPGGVLSRPTVELRQLLRPYPQFGNVNMRQASGARSRFHSVTAKLDKRLSAGWGGRFSYTWAQLKDDQFAEANFFSTAHQSPRPQNSYDLDAEYGISLLDVPHKIIAAPIVELPWGEGKKWATSGWRNAAFGGWTVSAIGTLEAGFPKNIVMNSDGTGSFSGVQRPNQVAGEDPSTGGTFNVYDRLDNLINPAAFSAAPAFTFGNQPRTDDRVRTPWRKNLDVVFAKNTGIGGPIKLQLRFEILNITNTPLFRDGQNGQLGNANFGRITRQGGFARILQFTVRGLW